MLGFLSISVTPMPLAISICADGLAEAAVADDDRRCVSGDCSGPSSPSRVAPRAASSQSVSRIRNGVVAIDRVTTAPNRDAASGVISRAAVAWANRTKPNSPAWLSSRPSRTLRGQLLPNSRGRGRR